MTSRKYNQGRKLGFQKLEDRQLMAGNVTAAITNHSLNLTGDNGSNQVNIAQVGTNQFAIYGQNGTTINGSIRQTFTVTGNISVNFKAGDDELFLNGYESGYMTLPGSLNVVLGEGKNSLTLDSAYISGNLSVSGGSGNDTVSMDESGVGVGTYNGGNNDCSINLGAGKNTVQFDYVRVQRDLLINELSSGGDTIRLEGSNVGRNANIQTGTGSDIVELNEFFANYNVNISTGAGKDYVVLGELVSTVGGKTPDPNPQQSLSCQNLKVDMGAGDDQLNIGNANAGFATIDGGTGNDSLYRDAKTGFGSLRQLNWQHQYNYGVGVIPANNPGPHRPTV